MDANPVKVKFHKFFFTKKDELFCYQVKIDCMNLMKLTTKKL